MKKTIMLLVSLLVGPALCLQAEMGEMEEMYVYDSETGNYTELQPDPELTSLEGQPPTEQLVTQIPPQTLMPGGLTHVINGEDWYQVDGDEFPYSAITYVKNQTEQCSGAMVGRYAMLTAAHCVYENGSLAPASHIKVAAGRSGSARKATGTKIFVLNGYSQKKMSGYDFAIVILNRPLGDSSGYLGFKSTPMQASKKIRVLGFPGTKPANNPWLSPGKINQVYEHQFLFTHDADIKPGSSGSPVLEDGQGSQVIAVNISQSSSSDKKVFNVAVTSQRLMTFIKEHRDKS